MTGTGWRPGRAATSRAVPFAAVGASGFVVNTLVLAGMVDGFGLHHVAGFVMATQASTMWNFLLSEHLVFDERTGAAGRLARYVKFAAVNGAALLLRGPLLALLVGLLGVNYLLANLVSLCVLFVGRFLVADSVIWRQSLPSTTPA